MTNENNKSMTQSEIASKGGRARAAQMTQEERSEVARVAAESRWGVEIPKANYTGVLQIADKSLSCAVLENGKRLLTQETFLSTIGRAARPKAGGSIGRLNDGLPPFIAAENLQGFVTDELRETTTPILFRSVQGGRKLGYSAELLPMVCEVYLKARDAGVIYLSQRHIVSACDLLMRALARVGIIALVDEATGYQEVRAKDELAKILEAYVQAELRPWTRAFPPEFFEQIYRLEQWPFKPGTSKRTPFVGKLINKYIYEPLPPGVLEELRRLNPVTEKGYRKHKHFQHLTADTGNTHLDRQITSVTMLMRISSDKIEFEENFQKAFGKVIQPRLPLTIEVDGNSVRIAPRLRLKLYENDEQEKLAFDS